MHPTVFKGEDVSKNGKGINQARNRMDSLSTKVFLLNLPKLFLEAEVPAPSDLEVVLDMAFLRELSLHPAELQHIPYLGHSEFFCSFFVFLKKK